MGNPNRPSEAARQKLRVLIVEDEPADVELMAAALKRARYVVSFDAVDEPASFERALARSGYDVILCDHNLRSWYGLEALEILQKAQLDIPFIVVTATLGDEAAVEYIKQGAADYVLKNRLERLPVAVRQALLDKAHRDEAAQLYEEVLASRREWELTFDSVPDPVLLLNKGAEILRCNRAVAGLAERGVSELVGQSCQRVLQCHPGAPERCPHVRALESGRFSRRDDLLTLEERVFECTANPMRGPGGNLVGTAVVLHDLTERVRSEQALRESEERFRQLAENLEEVFYTQDAARPGIDYVSPAYERVWGRTCESLYSDPDSWLDAIHPEDVARVRTLFGETLRDGTPMNCECRIRRPDGTERWIWDRAFSVRDEQGKPRRVVGFASDITARKHAEDQLRQAAKMEAIGRLAGGVAHDFNNLLTVIGGNARIILEHVPAEHPDRPLLEEVIEGGDRAAALTRQLLAFSRRQVLAPQPIDLNEIVLTTGNLLRRLIGEDIELVLLPGSGLGRVLADPGQIEQVLLNLAVNARDAMPAGGRLIIETANASVEAEDAVRHAELAPGAYVMLGVSDTGVGMNRATRAHIFEPFFTTKAPGKGTGLGLATVYGIVKQTGGEISVYSEPGLGATFKIYLPRIEEPAGRATETRTDGPVANGTETILVVEDEDGVRHVARRVLEARGYTVVEATCGEEAIAAVHAQTGTIDLMLTDVVMPGMSGPELASRLKGEFPRMKVLIVSGYTQGAIMDQAAQAIGSGFLQKPFNPTSLARKVREVLDGPHR